MELLQSPRSTGLLGRGPFTTHDYRSCSEQENVTRKCAEAICMHICIYVYTYKMSPITFEVYLRYMSTGPSYWQLLRPVIVDAHHVNLRAPLEDMSRNPSVPDVVKIELFSCSGVPVYIQMVSGYAYIYELFPRRLRFTISRPLTFLASKLLKRVLWNQFGHSKSF